MRLLGALSHGRRAISHGDQRPRHQSQSVSHFGTRHDRYRKMQARQDHMIQTHNIMPLFRVSGIYYSLRKHSYCMLLLYYFII